MKFEEVRLFLQGAVPLLQTAYRITETEIPLDLDLVVHGEVMDIHWLAQPPPWYVSEYRTGAPIWNVGWGTKEAAAQHIIGYLKKTQHEIEIKHGSETTFPKDKPGVTHNTLIIRYREYTNEFPILNEA